MVNLLQKQVLIKILSTELDKIKTLEVNGWFQRNVLFLFDNISY